MRSGDYEDAVDFVTQRATEKSCPFCTHQEWQLIDKADGAFLSMPVQLDEVGTSVPPEVLNKHLTRGWQYLWPPRTSPFLRSSPPRLRTSAKGT